MSALWKNETGGGDNDGELGLEGPTLGEVAREDVCGDVKEGWQGASWLSRRIELALKRNVLPMFGDLQWGQNGWRKDAEQGDSCAEGAGKVPGDQRKLGLEAVSF